MTLFAELKRRNVFRVGIAYIVLAWLLLQAGDTLAPALHLPDWVNSALAFFVILGFPLAIFFAWAFEMSPDGLKLEKNVERELNVGHVREGSVRKSGKKIRITAQLIETEPDAHLWSEPAGRADGGYGRWLGLSTRSGPLRARRNW